MEVRERVDKEKESSSREQVTPTSTPTNADGLFATAEPRPGKFGPAAILRMQQTRGNAYVCRMLAKRGLTTKRTALVVQRQDEEDGEDYSSDTSSESDSESYDSSTDTDDTDTYTDADAKATSDSDESAYGESDQETLYDEDDSDSSEDEDESE